MNKTMCRSNIFITSLVLILSFSCALCYAQQQSQQQQPAAKQQASARLPSPFPQVLSLEPKVLFQGDEKTLAINGKNFDEKMVFDFGRGIQAKFLKVSRSRTSATVRVLVDKAAKKGKRKVYISLAGRKTKVADITVEELVPRMLKRDIARQRAGITGSRIEVSPSAQATMEAPETGPIIVVSPNGGELLAPANPATISWIYDMPVNPSSGFNLTLHRQGASTATIPISIEDTIWDPETRTHSGTWNIPPDFIEGEYKLRVSAGEESDESYKPFYISYHRITSPEAGETLYMGERRAISWFNTGLPAYNNPRAFFVSLLNSAGQTLWRAEVPGTERYAEWTVGGTCDASGNCRALYVGGRMLEEGPYRVRVIRRRQDGLDVSVTSGPFNIRYPAIEFAEIVNSRSMAEGSDNFFRDDPVEIGWTGRNIDSHLTARVSVEVRWPVGGRTERFLVRDGVSPSGGHLTWIPSSVITDEMARGESRSFHCTAIIQVNDWNSLSYASEEFSVLPRRR